MTRYTPEHTAWLERQLADAENHLDALLYGEPVDLSADYDTWEQAEERALGSPEDRLRNAWNGIGQPPTHGRPAVTANEMNAAVKQAQADEIARLRREIALAKTPEADLVNEWFARTGVRR